MKVVLIDLDTERRRCAFPNLALMKLSAWHKQQGDEVQLNFPLMRADAVYASCVFTWHRQRQATVPPEASVGGLGLDLGRTLPPQVEHIMPDYSLYPNVDFSMGFTSRGCSRSCPWCKVPGKEGAVQTWASFHEFLAPGHKRLLLLDNNLLAAENWRDTLADLGDLTLEVDFNQGLDIRLITDEVAWYLKRVRTRKLRFAFDSLSYEKSVRQGVQVLTRAGIPSRHLSFYVLTGFQEDDQVIERMKLLASLNVDVFPMVYRDDEGREPVRRQLYDGDIFWHGDRRAISKFLRVVGRLPA